MHKSISILYDEHRSISAVLSALKSLTDMARKPDLRPRFEVFHAMIYYIDAFPERMHHPKEDKFLFALLLQRDPSARALVEDLQAEHRAGAQLVRDLEQALFAFEQTWPRGADRFAATVEAYSQFHWEHMRKEERQLLPLAERALGAADWAEVDAAFAGNDDPIADLREKDFDSLYQRIVCLAPAPIGLGEPWNRTGAPPLGGRRAPGA
ncbi:MAG: hemerythrin domain-containing protein [Betaproteobacteria bacterium]|nr:hemerythrin domain-containing protein [Betaproteobacteria bacterium]